LSPAVAVDQLVVEAAAVEPAALEQEQELQLPQANYIQFKLVPVAQLILQQVHL
jgi:hypothetical protein